MRFLKWWLKLLIDCKIDLLESCKSEFFDDMGFWVRPWVRKGRGALNGFYATLKKRKDEQLPGKGNARVFIIPKVLPKKNVYLKEIFWIVLFL